MVRLLTLSTAGLALLGSAVAHPGEAHDANHMKREIMKRDHVAAVGQRSLNQCSNSEGAQKMKARAIERRARKVEELRQKRGISAKPRKFKRDVDDIEKWSAINHNMTGSESAVDMFTPLSQVFDANTSCILAPEITDGPYYVVGEYMRSNVIEAEFCEGVPLFLEVQYVDVSNCNPIPAVAVDAWACNATGVYSGVESGQAGLNTTFLRGVQVTDHEGVVQFETIFPGHYQGRATHLHLLSHANASTVLSNGTVSVWDAPVTHIGQLFFPSDLIDEVEALSPYNTNTVEFTSNEEDMWSVLQADASYDPFPQFVYLGDSVEDGLFAWIQIGVNASADYNGDEYYNVAAYLDAEGGHALAGGIGGGGPGGPGGNGTTNGTAPTGAPPS